MDDNNSILFYFWAHGGPENYNPMDELDTSTFHDLVARAQTLFFEFPSPDLSVTAALEADINEYLQTQRKPLRLQMAYDFQIRNLKRLSAEFFAADLIKGTAKKVVLERTLEAPFDYLKESEKADLVFFESSLARALEARREFLAMSEEYQQARDRDVAKQICAFPETTFVLFGAGHPALAQRVAALGRPTEIHFPYPYYPCSFATQVRTKYRETGVLDQELFLREFAEGMACKGIDTLFGKKLSSREIDLLAHHYATSLTPNQILGFRDSLIFCKTMLSNVSYGDIFASYLQREHIAGVEEVHAELFLEY